MKLLMITRKVDKDDGLAGFTFNWIKKLAKHCNQLYVICLEQGNIVGLPDNVEVHSLGKEVGKNRLREFWRFQKLALQIVPRVDGVFTHQNPEYGILVAPWSKFFNKRLVAWYTHKAVGWKLRLLNSLADRMVTASQESFRLKSKKLKVLHHGIDTDLFSFKTKEKHNELRLLTISRISQIKNIHLMIDLVKRLKDTLDRKIILKIVGTVSSETEKIYLQKLKEQITGLNLESNVEFLGSIANDQTPVLYQEADMFLNFSDTGSLDKTIIESMSCGTPVFTFNEAAKNILPETLVFNKEEINQVINQIKELINLSVEAKNKLGESLRQKAGQDHNLDSLVKKISQQFNEK